jgi:HK97 family phage prohead protease
MTDHPLVFRDLPVSDIAIRSDGSGRTVIGYCAMFQPVSYEVTDSDGHYWEDIHARAFDRTLVEQHGRIGCYYNHARTLRGGDSERFSLPLGVVEEIRADGKGLLTAVRYSKTELADEVLTLIRDGSITGMSFSGKFIRSERQKRRGRDGLDLITRHECALREFGPTPSPANHDAAIVGVRADISNWRVSSHARRQEYLRLMRER